MYIDREPRFAFLNDDSFQDFLALPEVGLVKRTGKDSYEVLNNFLATPRLPGTIIDFARVISYNPDRITSKIKINKAFFNADSRAIDEKVGEWFLGWSKQLGDALSIYKLNGLGYSVGTTRALLTPRQLEIVYMLYQSQNQFVSTDSLMGLLESGKTTVTTNMSRIKGVFEEADSGYMIRTEPGCGYRLEPKN